MIKQEITAEKKSNEWCHLCGRRSDGVFVEFNLPENAEHDLCAGTRYVRMCKSCVAVLYASSNAFSTVKP